MSIENTSLKYASVAGHLQGVISGIIKYSDDEISPRIKRCLEEALQFSEKKLNTSKEDRRL